MHSSAIAPSVISFLRVCLDGYDSIQPGVSNIIGSVASPFQGPFKRYEKLVISREAIFISEHTLK